MSARRSPGCISEGKDLRQAITLNGRCPSRWAFPSSPEAGVAASLQPEVQVECGQASRTTRRMPAFLLDAHVSKCFILWLLQSQ